MTARRQPPPIDGVVDCLLLVYSVSHNGTLASGGARECQTRSSFSRVIISAANLCGSSEIYTPIKESNNGRAENGCSYNALRSVMRTCDWRTIGEISSTYVDWTIKVTVNSRMYSVQTLWLSDDRFSQFESRNVAACKSCPFFTSLFLAFYYFFPFHFSSSVVCYNGDLQGYHLMLVLFLLRQLFILQKYTKRSQRLHTHTHAWDMLV